MEKKILATVGEKEITNLDVENALKSLDPYQAMHFQTEEGKKQLLEDLVNQELFYMQAKEDQLHNDEDFKAEMKKIPLLSWIMYFVNCLFLDRENPRKGLKTIQKGTDYLQNGVSMFICPEGTRSKTNEMLPFKEGSLKMAIKAKKPIVPVGIINSAAIYEEHFPKIKPGTVKIIFGKPIETKDLSRPEQRELTSHVQECVAKLLDENK